jgi:hypothetical protein
LRARLVALEPKLKPAPKPVVEEGTKVGYPVQPANSTMPSGDQLEKLAAIVHASFPDLGDVDGPAFEGSEEARDEQWWKQYVASFRAIGALGRLLELGLARGHGAIATANRRAWSR